MCALACASADEMLLLIDQLGHHSQRMNGGFGTDRGHFAVAVLRFVPQP